MRPVIEEKLHLAISDNMLKQFFPDRYPACIEEFHQGVHLKDFKHVPFVFSSKEKNMVTKVLQPFLQFNRIQLTKVDPVSQSDMQYLLTAKDYAACFCWSMFIPSIRQENRNPEHSHIYIFPVKDEIETNRLMMVTRKGKIFQKYGKDFMRMVKNTCIAYAETDPEDE